MWQVHQYPLCPFSRKIRLALNEKGVAYDLVRENPWEQRDAFLDVNPAGQTPVMVNGESDAVLVDSVAIIEYFEETVAKMPLLGGTAAERAETRRLISWFDHKFWQEVTLPLLTERMFKRLVHRASPDATQLREAIKAANLHLDYIDYLLDHRRWLGGPTYGLADIAAAAQISVSDYLGGIDWRGHAQSKQWYSALKSRPAFRPLLAERMEVIAPPTHYDKLDF